jgi:hypothetical protein
MLLRPGDVKIIGDGAIDFDLGANACISRGQRAAWQIGPVSAHRAIKRCGARGVHREVVGRIESIAPLEPLYVRPELGPPSQV